MARAKMLSRRKVSTVSVVHVPGKQFVTLSSTGKVMTSPDGVVWTKQTTVAAASDAPGPWNCITYGKNLYVAIAGGGGNFPIMTSPDAITWTLRAVPTILDWRFVSFGSGTVGSTSYFVACGGTMPYGTVTVDANNEFAYSSDGLTWVAATNVDYEPAWFCICPGNSRFAATNDRLLAVAGPTTRSFSAVCSSLNLGPPTVWTSTPSSTPPTLAQNILVFDTVLLKWLGLARVGNLSGTHALQSTDGINWSNDIAGDVSNHGWNDAAFNGGTSVSGQTGASVACQGNLGGTTGISPQGTFVRAASVAGQITWSAGTVNRYSKGDYTTMEFGAGGANRFVILGSKTNQDVGLTNPISIDSVYHGNAAGQIFIGSTYAGCNQWKAICAGSDKLFAVGLRNSYDAAMYSTNGTSWLKVILDSTAVATGEHNWTGCAWGTFAGQNRYCAVGSGFDGYDGLSRRTSSSYMSSSDGASFGPITVTKSFTVAASTDIFTVVAHGLSVGSSIVFNASPVPPAGITAGVPYFLIAGSFSVDTFRISATSGGTLLDVTANGSGTFNFAGAAQPILLSSSAGNTSPTLSSVCYGTAGGVERFVTVSFNTAASIFSYYSIDGGLSFVSGSAPSGAWQGVCSSPSLYVAVANAGSNLVMTSPDGITWTARTPAATQKWNSVAFGAGLFVAVSSDGTNRVMTSPDGITWSLQSAAFDVTWQSVTFANGWFVAVGDGGTNTTGRVMISNNGLSWSLIGTALKKLSGVAGHPSIGFAATVYGAASSDNQTIMMASIISPTTWTATATPGIDSTLIDSWVSMCHGDYP